MSQISTPLLDRKTLECERLLENRVVLATDRLDQACEHMSRVFAPVKIMLRNRVGTLKFRHCQLEFDSCSVHLLQYGLVTLAVPEMTNCYLIQFNVAGWCEISQADRTCVVGPASTFVINPVHEVRKVWGPDCRQVILWIDRTRLESYLSEIIQIDVRDRLEFLPIVQPFGSKDHVIRGYLDFLCRNLLADRGDIVHHRIRLPFERSLFSLLLATFPHTFSEAFDSSCGQPVPRFIRRVEEYIRENVASCISMDDLVQVSGMSARSIQLGFRRYLNTTPTAFIESLRLDLARERLIAAGPGNTTVTEVALGCGFKNLGRFSGTYRQRFGIRPSDTLRKGI